MQSATAISTNHSQDGAMDARWSENAKYCFYRKEHNVPIMVIIVSRPYHISYLWVSNEYWKVENVFLKHILGFISLEIRVKQDKFDEFISPK